MNGIPHCTHCKVVTNLPIRPYSKKEGKEYFMCRDCGNKRMRTYLDKFRIKVFDYYGSTCNCCGETNKMFLTIDHVNNDGNIHRHPGGRRISGVHLYRIIVRDSYPDGYQVLCMNCNYGKHVNGGVCPHEIV